MLPDKLVLSAARKSQHCIPTRRGTQVAEGDGLLNR